MSGSSDRFQVLRHLPDLVFEDELRGYNKSQVDRVLEALAPLVGEVDALEQKLAAAETRAASAEARLVQASEDPASLEQPPASTASAEATPETTADFDETLRNTLLLAQRTADQTVKEANEQAEKIRSEAQAEVDELLAEGRAEAETIDADNAAERKRLEAEIQTERETRLAEVRARTDEQLAKIEAELNEAHAAQRQELVSQIGELQGIRDLLADDVERFEAHLATRRDAVRTALAELTAVVEDNSALRGEMPPAATEVDVVDPDDYGDIKVQSAAVDELELELAAAGEAVHAAGDHAVDGADTDADDGADTDGVQRDGEPDDDATDSNASSVMLGEVAPDPDAVGPVTEAVDVLALDDLEAQDVPEVDDVAELTFDDDGAAPLDEAGVTNPWGTEEVAVAQRPAWADAVPGVEADTTPGPDPFLDELRRATSEDVSSDAEDEALDRFLENGGTEGRGQEGRGGGWFGRGRR